MGPFSPAEYFWLMGMGLAVGLYGTLIGAGGGFILMPLLLMLNPKASPEACSTAISLAVVFFNALAGSESYAMMRRIDYKSGLMFAAATIPGAIIGALNTSAVPRRLFDGILGVILLAAAVFLFLRPAVKPHETKTHLHHPNISRHLVSAVGDTFDYNFNPLVGIGISFAVGYASSFLGIGGGIIHVPASDLLSGLSGAHCHGHVSFHPCGYGLDRHTGAHLDRKFPRRCEAYLVVVHRCLAGGSHRRIPLQPDPGLLDHPQPVAGPGACGDFAS